jgi:hypothetical protein
VRLAAHNRLVISEVSAGGASISLADKTASYFDQYLDEIVYFFESVRRVDIVVFEDLDRFDDPGIFEALRELNTLLNNSKQMNGKTIRFVYALRDSIFEKLGYDTKIEEDDAARAEAARANRTKFFDLVIPIVPFITHRTSRDLLTQILDDNNLAPIVPVSPSLVDLTARHLPDMRLLTNIRNEYSVFAKRLIIDKHGMDSLEADKLFAIVVYKNIHLSDFELVLLGRSNLDTLYRLSRELVTESINIRRKRLRRITDAVILRDTLAERAGGWGKQLSWYFEKIKVVNNQRHSLKSFNIGGTEFKPNQVETDEFWRKLITDGNAVTARFELVYQQDVHLSATMDDIQHLLGGSLPLDDWDGTERAELAREEARLQDDLEALRTADFKDIIKRTDFTLTCDGDHVPFNILLEQHINSEVGRALITDGYIDRYYTLYVAQYYGDRVAPNAMNFIVQNVDTNRSDINYRFNDGDEIASVLRETNRSFLSEASAYNVNILDYLLERSDTGAHTILSAVIHRIGEAEQTFLETYLAEGAYATASVAYLAGRWPAVLIQLLEKINLTRGRRVDLVDAALANSEIKISYELDASVRTFLQDNYKGLSTIAKPRTKADDETEPTAGTGGGPDADTPTDTEIRNTIVTMTRAGVVFDDLAVLKPLAIHLVVERDCYTVTAANLRTALGDPITLSLDRIRAIDAGVYEDVLERPDDYLKAITNDIDAGVMRYADAGTGTVTELGMQVDTVDDTTSRRRSRTPWTVDDPAAFADIVTDLKNHSKQQAAAFISRANPDCMVNDLATVPDTTWEALAECLRFPATLANIDSHIKHLGELDADLAAILTAAGSITVPALENPASHDEVSDTKARVAETILNASTTLPEPVLRIKLASSLGLDNPLPATSIRPETGTLLGLLIREQLCVDEPALFEHFNTDDWETLRYAINQSAKFAEFISPDLLNAHLTSQLLVSRDIKPDLKRTVLRHFDEFIPADNRATLAAAGRAALTTNTRIDAKHITSIASGTGDADLVVRLLHQRGDSINIGEIIGALTRLPKPYNELTSSGAQLTFPRNDHHTSVLKRLHNGDRITTRAYTKSLNKDARIEVRVK